jgi:hypothetical protein
VLIPPLERERENGGVEPTKYNYSAEDLGREKGEWGGVAKALPGGGEVHERWASPPQLQWNAFSSWEYPHGENI